MLLYLYIYIFIYNEMSVPSICSVQIYVYQYLCNGKQYMGQP